MSVLVCLSYVFIFIGMLSRSRIAGSQDMLNIAKLFLIILIVLISPKFLLALGIVNIFPFLPAWWLQTAAHCYSLHFPDNLPDWASFHKYTPFTFSFCEICTSKHPVGHLFKNKFEILSKSNYKWYTVIDFNISNNLIGRSMPWVIRCAFLHPSKVNNNMGFSPCPQARPGGCCTPAACWSGCSREREKPNSKLGCLHLLWEVEIGTENPSGGRRPHLPIQILSKASSKSFCSPSFKTRQPVSQVI